MLGFIGRRLVLLIPMMFLISLIPFIIIQLPPGDYLSTYIVTLEASGQIVDEATVEALKIQYGLDDPIYIQYLKWVGNVVRGNFGQSLQWQAPVKDLIGERVIEEELRGEDPALVRRIIMYLEMGVHRAAGIPAWIDGDERSLPVGIRGLEAA